MSGHCDGICCDKGSECCKTVDDCTTQPGGLGMSCDNRAQCEGSAGKITCTNEFKCVTINGQRDDRACTNRVEANDCGYYTSVFCLGGELQNGAPECATACSSDVDCDLEAHCKDGECVPDLPNGESCTRPEDCVSSYCRNIVDGVGICCGLLGDCCKTADDCPATYRRDPMCTDLQDCRGSRTNAVCNFNICGSESMPANDACNGMMANECGFFQNVVCMAGRNNTCRTSCTNVGDCDPGAFCDSGRCVEKRDLGQACTMANQCESNACNNNVCCPPGIECCSNVEQCVMGVEALCDDPRECQGSRRPPQCMSNRCVYGARVPDDRACTTGGSDCGLYRDLRCNGMPMQDACATTCDSTSDATACDSNASCLLDANGRRECRVPTAPVGGMGGMGGMGGAEPPPDDDENAGPGNGNGNGSSN